MSWNENLNNIKFAITTGDGKTFYPLWKTGIRSKDYNTSSFDFIKVPGSLVERKEPKSGKYPLVFWFEGADNVEQAAEFDKSADDSRVWTITHPLYGTIKGQPVGIEYNDENQNITQVTVDFWQSIDVDFPGTSSNVQDNSREKFQKVSTLSAVGFVERPNALVVSDVNKLKQSNLQTSKSLNDNVLSKSVVDDSFYAKYQNTIAVALKAADKLVTDPLSAITSSQDLMSLPANLETSVKLKLSGFIDVYNNISKVFSNYFDKAFFESQGSSVIASYCLSAVNPLLEDYVLTSEVEQASTDLLAIYSDYLENLDNASVSVYDVNNTWQPDASVQTQLHDLVMYTLGNLYNLGFDAQQERIVYTDKDTNIFLLTHRYLGLDANDENIERFRQINGIQLNELFKIKKGRKIKYYV